MFIKYYETDRQLIMWDVDFIKDKHFKRNAYPLAETQAKRNGEQRTFVKEIMSCLKTALLNIKHKHKNIRIFAYYALKTRCNIPEATKEEANVLFKNMNASWTSHRHVDRESGKIFGG